MPQLREAAEPYTPKLFRGKRLLATEPLRALVVGAFERGLSLRDVESVCDPSQIGKRLADLGVEQALVESPVFETGDFRTP